MPSQGSARLQPGLRMKARHISNWCRHPPMPADPHTRLAEFLSVGDSRQNLPGVKIRDAATMLVIDRAGPTHKVLLGGATTATSSCRANMFFPAAGSSAPTVS